MPAFSLPGGVKAAANDAAAMSTERHNMVWDTLENLLDFLLSSKQ